MLNKNRWSEEDSSNFISYGDYFIPERHTQIQLICHLLSSLPVHLSVVDLGCGEGVLCEAILKHFPQYHMTGMDLSKKMLQQAKKRLHPFKDRISLQPFELQEQSWRSFATPVSAFVSCLAIHHLNDQEKKELFYDLFHALTDEGVLIITDIIRPASAAGFKTAADAWNAYVQQHAPPAAWKEFTSGQWNYFQYPDLDPIDQPSTLVEQLNWLIQAGFQDVDVHWLKAGHAIFAGWKK